MIEISDIKRFMENFREAVNANQGYQPENAVVILTGQAAWQVFNVLEDDNGAHNFAPESFRYLAEAKAGDTMTIDNFKGQQGRLISVSYPNAVKHRANLRGSASSSTAFRAHSNFMIGISAYNTTIFYDREFPHHAQSFIRFLKENIIETVKIEDLPSKAMANVIAGISNASNEPLQKLACILHDYVSPLMNGKTFSVKTAVALNAIFNQHDIAKRLSDCLLQNYPETFETQAKVERYIWDTRDHVKKLLGVDVIEVPIQNAVANQQYLTAKLKIEHQKDEILSLNKTMARLFLEFNIVNSQNSLNHSGITLKTTKFTSPPIDLAVFLRETLCALDDAGAGRAAITVPASKDPQQLINNLSLLFGRQLYRLAPDYRAFLKDLSNMLYAVSAQGQVMSMQDAAHYVARLDFPSTHSDYKDFESCIHLVLEELSMLDMYLKSDFAVINIPRNLVTRLASSINFMRTIFLNNAALRPEWVGAVARINALVKLYGDNRESIQAALSVGDSSPLASFYMQHEALCKTIPAGHEYERTMAIHLFSKHVGKTNSAITFPDMFFLLEDLALLANKQTQATVLTAYEGKDREGYKIWQAHANEYLINRRGTAEDALRNIFTALRKKYPQHRPMALIHFHFQCMDYLRKKEKGTTLDHVFYTDLLPILAPSALEAINSAAPLQRVEVMRKTAEGSLAYFKNKNLLGLTTAELNAEIESDALFCEILTQYSKRFFKNQPNANLVDSIIFGVKSTTSLRASFEKFLRQHL